MSYCSEGTEENKRQQIFSSWYGKWCTLKKKCKMLAVNFEKLCCYQCSPYTKCSPSGLKERKTQMFSGSSSSTSKLLIQIQITLSLLRGKLRPKPVSQHKSSSRRALPCLRVSPVVRGRILLPLLQVAVLLWGPSTEGRTSHYLQYHQPASPMAGGGEEKVGLWFCW